MTDALIGVAHRVAMECDLIYSRRNGHTPLIVDMWIRIHFLAIRIQQFSQSGSGFSGKKNSCGTLKLAEVDPHQNRKKRLLKSIKKTGAGVNLLPISFFLLLIFFLPGEKVNANRLYCSNFCLLI